MVHARGRTKPDIFRNVVVFLDPVPYAFLAGSKLCEKRMRS